MYSTHEDELEVQRGYYSRHSPCLVCGRLRPANGWAHPVILERYLDNRWAYLYDDPYVDERLIETESLRERFPTLRFYPVPVVPEPLDGQTLPGDPGWTGAFKKLPIPRPPTTKPEKGIGLWLGPPSSDEMREAGEGKTGEGWVTLYLPGDAEANALLDVHELEESLVKAVRAAQAGEFEEHGAHPRKRAWYVRFHGPNMTRLFETVKYAMSRFRTRLPKRWHITMRVKDGRERRASI